LHISLSRPDIGICRPKIEEALPDEEMLAKIGGLDIFVTLYPHRDLWMVVEKLGNSRRTRARRTAYKKIV